MKINIKTLIRPELIFLGCFTWRYASDTTKNDTANIFRHGLFQCFFHEDLAIRVDALKTLSQVVEFWTHSWLNFLARIPTSYCHSARPPIVHHTGSGSDFSSVNTSGTVLRRDSSFKMQFDDVFGLDVDEVSTTALPKRADSETTFIEALLSAETEHASWTSVDYAVSPSDLSSPFLDTERRFSNKPLERLDTAVSDVIVASKAVAEELWGPEEMKTNLENFYIWLLRFSIDCPHKEVRKGCREILGHAESLGAQLPVVASSGPSIFVPPGDTIGLDYVEHNLPGTPSSSGKSSSLLDPPSDDDTPQRDQTGHLPSGIMIPGNRPIQNNARPRSRSRGKTTTSNALKPAWRTGTSLVSALFQTPPSPILPSSQKSKRRTPRRHTPKFFPKPKQPSEEVRRLQIQAYLRTGRVGNLNKILFIFPRFAETCRETTDLFLSEDCIHGPLPQTWRIYLGILAAAEKRCQYYVSLLSEKFLTVRGNKDWLKGIHYTPAKLQKISMLNMLLAHLPWTISRDNIADLVHIDQSQTSLDLRWSVAEIIQALLILSFYHSKSAMALAWGILPEPDVYGGTTVATSTAVAPFGSIARSASMSTDAASFKVDVGPAGEYADVGLPKGSLRRWNIDNLPNTDYVQLPDRLQKLPEVTTPLSPYPDQFSSSVKTALLENTTVHGIDPAILPRRMRNQKRRKSFQECSTADELPPLFSKLNIDFLSSSAPNSLSYTSQLSITSSKPSSSFYQMTDVFSPSSSMSSMLGNTGMTEQSPANFIIDDHLKYLHSDSYNLIPERLDPNNDANEFLPMEEFDWERNASSLISDYLEGVVELLDKNFQEAMDAGVSGFMQSVPEELLCRPKSETSQPFSMFTHPEQSSRGDRDFVSGARSCSEQSIHNDTKSIKEAAWYYSLRLLNVQKDDFRYSDIKYLLDKGARRYLKRVCSQPHMVSVGDWVGVQGISNEEKCMLGLLACQARLLGEILWGVKGVSEFLG